MKCYNCQNEYDDTYKFCPHCSSPNETNKCTNCGKEYDKSHKFCPHCSYPNVSLPNEPRVKKCSKCNKEYDDHFKDCPYCSTKKTIVKGILWSCVGLAIALGLYWGINYIHEKQIEDAYKEYTGSYNNSSKDYRVEGNFKAEFDIYN